MTGAEMIERAAIITQNLKVTEERLARVIAREDENGSTNPIIARFGDYKVKLDTDADADTDYPWLVLDGEGDVYDTSETRKGAIELARSAWTEDRLESLRDEISNLAGECDDVARLESVLSLLIA